jgi:prepilin-type N-terminal cleavage/methylation domain-containing protein
MRTFFKKIKQAENKGFTMVETIIAIFIFSVAITAIMAVFSKGIIGINYAKNEMIASYLAQEGIEYIRNLRDDYIYSEGENGWQSFLERLQDAKCAVPGQGGCYFDDSHLNFGTSQGEMIQNLFILPCDKECPSLRYNSTNGRYNYDPNGANSSFIRAIKVKFPNGMGGEGAIITSVVSFSGGGIAGEVSFSEDLYDLTQE